VSTLSREAAKPDRALKEAFHSLQMDLASYEGGQFLILTDQFSVSHTFLSGEHVMTKQVTKFIMLFISTYSTKVVI
jgi:hypothetical protein